MKEIVWHKWSNRKSIKHKNQPGVYYIALPKTKSLENKKFSFIKEIIYIGQTNCKGGINMRLNQFERSMKTGKNNVHAGAERVRFKHRDSKTFFEKAYVAVKSFTITGDNSPNDWRQKGNCLKCEYDGFADYIKLHGKLPEFNSKSAPKLRE